MYSLKPNYELSDILAVCILSSFVIYTLITDKYEHI